MILFLLLVLWGCGEADVLAETTLMRITFDEVSGTTFTDATGNGHTGSCSSCPTLGVQGAIGNAASFASASSQYVNIANVASLKPVNVVAVSARIRATSMPANGGEVASMGDSYSLRVLASGAVRFFFYNGAGIWTTIDSTGVNVLDNAFHLIVGRKTSTTLTVEVDGVVRGTLFTSTPINYTLGTEFNIGRHANGDSSRYFNGVIDDVTVFDPTGEGNANLFPGGILEAQGITRSPKWSTSFIATFMPLARGPFSFPAPYFTRAARITDASDCAFGQDCVFSVGYSYWRNINNHVGRDNMHIFACLNPIKGGAGCTLFNYNKNTEVVTKVGPLFPVGHALTGNSGTEFYFSATMPDKLYIANGQTLRRYDVISKTFETLVDVVPFFGTNRAIVQAHSSDDDLVHSFTLCTGAFCDTTNHATYLGCVVYFSITNTVKFYPKTGNYDECQIDKSGQYLLMQQDSDPGPIADGLESLFINVNNNQSWLVLDQNGALGHADSGYGYFIGIDNFNSFPGAVISYTMPGAIKSAVPHFRSSSFSFNPSNHPSHTNARQQLPMAQNYACGSNADTTSIQNEIVCYLLTSPSTQLTVAPVMTDMNAAGGGTDSFFKFPKGNLDISGRYFIWSSNLGGSRLDIFIVKVPSQLITDQQAPQAPAGLQLR